jgi:hypothetical protein
VAAEPVAETAVFAGETGLSAALLLQAANVNAIEHTKRIRNKTKSLLLRYQFVAALICNCARR